MTSRLYYEDAYRHSFTAQVIETTVHNQHPAVILDQTYFYPTGGGQPHDTGMMIPERTTREGTSRILNVIEVMARPSDGAILHVLDGALDEEPVQCTINWGRRFDFMQQHTGQHILSQAFNQTCGASTIGFHLGGEVVTIDIDKANLTREDIEATEALANRIIFDNRAVSTRFTSREESEGIRARRIPGSVADDALRVVTIEDFDMTACGGTHVARTGEIGMILVLTTERYKGGFRITFVCGGRAFHAARSRISMVNVLAAEMSCAINELPASVSRLREQVGNAEKTMKAMRERLADFEGAALADSAELHGTVRIAIAAYDIRDASELRLLAARITQEPRTMAILGSAGDKALIICARSADLDTDMNSVLRRILEPLGGRGGGHPALAQGGVVGITREQLLEALQSAARTL